jgi:hypothetical protein
VEVDGQVHGDPVPGYLRLLRYCRGTLAFFQSYQGELIWQQNWFKKMSVNKHWQL